MQQLAVVSSSVLLSSLLTLAGGGLFKLPRFCFLAGGSREFSAAAEADAGARFRFRQDLLGGSGGSEDAEAVGAVAVAAAAG